MSGGLVGNAPFDWVKQSAAAANPVENVASAQEEMLRAAAIERQNYAALVFDVFGTGRGPELLERLRRHTIETGMLNVSGSLAEGEITLSSAEWLFLREGQNSMVRHLEFFMALAQNPPEELEVKGSDNG